MTTKIRALGFAVCAIAALAAARQEPKSPPQDPAQAPAESERVVHVHRADLIVGVIVKGAGDQEVGKLESLVIDSGSGRIVYAVVGFGGMLGLGVRHRLVPALALRFAEKRGKERMECEIVALLTPEQVAACPALERGAAITAEDEKKALVAAKLPADSNPGQSAPAKLVSSVELEGCVVRGRAQAVLGRIERVLVDPMEARVAYLALDIKGVPGLDDKHVAIPWQAAQLRVDKNKKLVLETPLSKERVEAAPAYVEKDWKKMASPAWIRELASFYEVEPYWARLSPATAERTNPIREKD